MGLMDWMHETAEKMRREKDPKYIKKKLKQKIEVQKLKNELEKAKADKPRRQMYMGGKSL